MRRRYCIDDKVKTFVIFLSCDLGFNVLSLALTLSPELFRRTTLVLLHALWCVKPSCLYSLLYSVSSVMDTSASFTFVLFTFASVTPVYMMFDRRGNRAS